MGILGINKHLYHLNQTVCAVSSWFQLRSRSQGPGIQPGTGLHREWGVCSRILSPSLHKYLFNGHMYKRAKLFDR